MMLREYEQLSYSEIADLLHIPLNTVRSQLFRLRMALKDCPRSAAEGGVNGYEGSCHQDLALGRIKFFQSLLHPERCVWGLPQRWFRIGWPLRPCPGLLPPLG